MYTSIRRPVYISSGVQGSHWTICSIALRRSSACAVCLWEMLWLCEGLQSFRDPASSAHNVILIISTSRRHVNNDDEGKAWWMFYTRSWRMRFRKLSLYQLFWMCQKSEVKRRAGKTKQGQEFQKGRKRDLDLKYLKYQELSAALNTLFRTCDSHHLRCKKDCFLVRRIFFFLLEYLFTIHLCEISMLWFYDISG